MTPEQKVVRRPVPPADFAFLFLCDNAGVEANTLAHALEMRPDLTAEQLEEVWCLHTANMIWTFTDRQPWRDQEATHD